MKPMYIHSFSAINAQCDCREGEEMRVPQGNRLAAREPDYKECIPDAALRRRMSRIVRMGVSAALACLKGTDQERIDAIITATGLGCLKDTEKFMDSLLEHEERLLSPTAFIQSTFNTIGAQIALLCKNHHYNMTYVHRGFSFESALLDAQLMLDEGEARQVLVGAVDELTEAGFRIMERMGFWRQVAAGEGAHFLIVGDEAAENGAGVIRGVETFRGNRTQEEVLQRTVDFLATRGCSLQEVDVVLYGGERSWDLFLPDCRIDFKTYSGEFPTASAFAVWLGCCLLQGREFSVVRKPEVKKLLIYNNYRNVNHSLIFMEKAG